MNIIIITFDGKQTGPVCHGDENYANMLVNVLNNKYASLLPAEPPPYAFMMVSLEDIQPIEHMLSMNEDIYKEADRRQENKQE